MSKKCKNTKKHDDTKQKERNSTKISQVVYVDDKYGSDRTGMIESKKYKFKSISAAIQHISQYPDVGWTIIICAGIYRENVIITPNISIKAQSNYVYINTITITGNFFHNIYNVVTNITLIGNTLPLIQVDLPLTNNFIDINFTILNIDNSINQYSGNNTIISLKSNAANSAVHFNTITQTTTFTNTFTNTDINFIDSNVPLDVFDWQANILGPENINFLGITQRNTLLNLDKSFFNIAIPTSKILLAIDGGLIESDSLKLNMPISESLTVTNTLNGSKIDMTNLVIKTSTVVDPANVIVINLANTDLTSKTNILGLNMPDNIDIIYGDSNLNQNNIKITSQSSSSEYQNGTLLIPYGNHDIASSNATASNVNAIASALDAPIIIDPKKVKIWPLAEYHLWIYEDQPYIYVEMNSQQLHNTLKNIIYVRIYNKSSRFLTLLNARGIGVKTRIIPGDIPPYTTAELSGWLEQVADNLRLDFWQIIAGPTPLQRS